MRIVLLQQSIYEQKADAAALAQALAAPHIRFGDLMRSHLVRRTGLGARAAAVMNSGEPFPDEIATAILRDTFDSTAPAAFLLGGHPRSTTQARALDDLLHECGAPLDGVLYLRLPEDEVERRIRQQAARRLCRNDLTHRYEPPADPLAAGRHCTVCGGELYQRKDDDEDVIRSRYRTHEAIVEPVARHYADRSLLTAVEAVGTPDEVAARAVAALGGRAS
ncbi:adenylate kinase family protein [Actinacidiphila bryophytorum]|uniref:Adenylate kinase n=1 Tax=Actinacidiphila bryophytorum TaxID=1436133 RepID=A0A9W4GY11_9ACTN|nr:nucleoside monophosphate kinase [Actinacidiphila bryophytorum]MBM9438880.1 nucleoside monophosphate kinase [Actinacidiphila bryophytorum]MBN6547984.1 nucleoside monophosphate kinase [Actinacidiphila bryophytorum]CAG7615649.1 Adenylate kinase [Actinacidiphila bryophytorum]